jgi:transcription termination factor Rho
MTKKEITHADLQTLLELAAEQQAQIARLANEVNELIVIIEEAGDLLTKLRRSLKDVIVSPRYKTQAELDQRLSEIVSRERVARIREMTK